MQDFFDRVQAFLDSRASTRILVFVIVILVAASAWGVYQYLTDERSTSIEQAQRSEFSENNFITKYIPHRTPFYSISYDRRGTDPVKIKVFTDSPYYRSQALQYMLRYDQEVTVKHPIEFVDYKAPIELGKN